MYMHLFSFQVTALYWYWFRIQTGYNVSASDIWCGGLCCLWASFMCFADHWALLRMLWRTSSHHCRISPWQPEFELPASDVLIDGDVTIINFDSWGTCRNLPVWFPSDLNGFGVYVFLLVGSPYYHSNCASN